MKKIFGLILLIGTVLPSFAFAPPEIIQVHDIQMINEQRFRHNVINDYKEVQEEKARFEKQNKPFETSVENPVINKEPEFINENGEVKIKL